MERDESQVVPSSLLLLILLSNSCEQFGKLAGAMPSVAVRTMVDLLAFLLSGLLGIVAPLLCAHALLSAELPGSLGFAGVFIAHDFG